MGHFNPKPGTFGAFMQAHGIADFTVMDKRLKGSPGRSVARHLHSEPKKVAPNSPMLGFVAKALDVPVTELQPFALHAPLEPKWLAKVTKQINNNTIPRGKKHGLAVTRSKPGKSLVHVPKVKGVPKGRVVVSANGNGKRLSVKERRLALRETVRTLFTSVNIGIMLGQKKMPDLPLKDLRLVLVDYAELKGFRGQMLLDEGFAEAFE